MEDGPVKEGTLIVPRSAAPFAPGDSLYPSVPYMEHEWFCVKDVRTTTCSCGLTQLRLERGDFVRYDASMCVVSHPEKVSLPPALPHLSVFLKLLADKSARVDMQRFNREEDG